MPPRTYVGVPIRASGRPVGVLSVLHRTERQLSVDDVVLLVSVADHLGIAVENARLRQQSEQLVVLEERERLARELHDAVTQSLYSLNLFAEAAREQAQQGNLDRLQSYLGEIDTTAHQALKEMRLMLYELRPSVLEEEGLLGALRRRLDTVEARAGIDARFTSGILEDLPPVIEKTLYRIAQEALNNALKHAAASSVAVHLLERDEFVILEITDDGCGFDPSENGMAGGMGLSNMRYRAEKIGGSVTIQTSPGRGTTVRAQVNSHHTLASNQPIRKHVYVSSK
jgi:signal transduction histidine kinase